MQIWFLYTRLEKVDANTNDRESTFFISGFLTFFWYWTSTCFWKTWKQIQTNEKKNKCVPSLRDRRKSNIRVPSEYFKHIGFLHLMLVKLLKTFEIGARQGFKANSERLDTNTHERKERRVHTLSVSQMSFPFSTCPACFYSSTFEFSWYFDVCTQGYKSGNKHKRPKQHTRIFRLFQTRPILKDLIQIHRIEIQNRCIPFKFLKCVSYSPLVRLVFNLFIFFWCLTTRLWKTRCKYKRPKIETSAYLFKHPACSLFSTCSVFILAGMRICAQAMIDDLDGNGNKSAHLF